MSEQEQFVANKRLFTDFLFKDLGNGNYLDTRVQEMITNKLPRLLIDLDDMHDVDEKMTQNFKLKPHEYLPAFEEALREAIETKDPLYFRPVGFVAGDKTNTAFIGIKGSFGSNHVTPRGLHAYMLGQLVRVDGIIVKTSLMRPKLVRSEHFCPATKQYLSREYRDATSMAGLPTPAVMPKQDDAGNPLETEFGLSTYRDYQTLVMQEMPESAPAGQLPRSIDIIVENDLVDKLKPGDRVGLVGVYRALASKGQNAASGTATFKTVLIANNSIAINRSTKEPDLNEEDINNIRKLAKKKNCFDILTNSIAPSICGMQYVKQAMLLMLLGGIERLLPNIRVRGDINILLVGDPSTAKSQTLRYMLGTAPLAISTSGRGSTGVGLTAAVVPDPETGERTLQAGAMVLADRGIVCIDEFDKMSDSDRVAMHEVMEQQTVSIAKAGVQTSLNARCSVLAAANPIYGKFDMSRSIMENVGLPDSLLSRFDLLFVVLDSPTLEAVRRVADHVVRMHRRQADTEAPNYADAYGIVNAAYAESRALAQNDSSAAASSASGASGGIYVKYDPLLHASRDQEILTQSFLKKFLFFAKARYRPKMSKEAANVIAEKYTQLRQKAANQVGRDQTLPITARTLEAMIRLSTALAKSRLSHAVSKKDAKRAFALLNYAINFKERLVGDEEFDIDDSDDEEEAAAAAKKAKPAARRPGKKDDSDDDDDDAGSKPRRGRRAGDDDEEYVPAGASSRGSESARESSRSRSKRSLAEAESDEEAEEEVVSRTPSKGKAKAATPSSYKRSRRAPAEDIAAAAAPSAAAASSSSVFDFPMEDEESVPESVPVTAAQTQVVKNALARIFRASRGEAIELSKLMIELDKVGAELSIEQARSCLAKLQAANTIFMDQDMIYDTQ